MCKPASQVVAYGIARPAREVLFTVVSRDEKYRAKVQFVPVTVDEFSGHEIDNALINSVAPDKRCDF